MIELQPLLAAYQTARRDLLAMRGDGGHWVGELSSSAFATATAASAIRVVSQRIKDDGRREAYQQVAARSVAWLASCQNADGGWGDTQAGPSNLAATMLVQAAIHLARQDDHYADPLANSRLYVETHGGLPGLRKQYGSDRTMLTAILVNCALAGMVGWNEVPALAFEVCWLPRAWLRSHHISATGYIAPARVALGQARFFHRWPRNPLQWLVRRLSVGKSLRQLGRMQPLSGGFLESPAWTSFVVMGLASTGRGQHPIARRGFGFLFDSVRGDGSWSIDLSLSVWNTSLAVGALSAASGDVGALGSSDWLLACQRNDHKSFSDAQPGGWACSDAAGSLPDTDATSTALQALAVLLKSGTQSQRERIETAAAAGIDWLLAMQNEDGGWPTFCRGLNREPFDGSGTDLTAHALRALQTWKDRFADRAIAAAIQRGLEYLARQQRPEGSWCPIWFGNPNFALDENLVYGTSQVVLAYRDLDQIDARPAQRGLEWLAANADTSGGWGGGRGDPPGESSSEETAMAVEALLSDRHDAKRLAVLKRGLNWLVEAVEQSRHRQPAPIGLHLARLWYSEKVFPLAYTVSALGRAVKLLSRSR